MYGKQHRRVSAPLSFRGKPRGCLDVNARASRHRSSGVCAASGVMHARTSQSPCPFEQKMKKINRLAAVLEEPAPDGTDPLPAAAAAAAAEPAREPAPEPTAEHDAPDSMAECLNSLRSIREQMMQTQEADSRRFARADAALREMRLYQQMLARRVDELALAVRVTGANVDALCSRLAE